MNVNDPNSSPAHLPFARMREDSVMTSIRVSPRLSIIVSAGQHFIGKGRSSSSRMSRRLPTRALNPLQSPHEPLDVLRDDP
jgi:hypothetical protein